MRKSHNGKNSDWGIGVRPKLDVSIRLKIVFGQVCARNKNTSEIIPYVNQQARGLVSLKKEQYLQVAIGHFGMMHCSVIDNSSDVRRLKIPVLLKVTTTENYGCKIIFIS
ncbi:hypothetical protein DKL61_09725 [Gammaproteobacteria bacterium ESL0073]|nr:hypothetical protein DKL61_09725 [Gammaproteobacteria bacterium ESL0073]